MWDVESVSPSESPLCKTACAARQPLGGVDPQRVVLADDDAAEPEVLGDLRKVASQQARELRRPGGRLPDARAPRRPGLARGAQQRPEVGVSAPTKSLPGRVAGGAGGRAVHCDAERPSARECRTARPDRPRSPSTSATPSGTRLLPSEHASAERPQLDVSAHRGPSWRRSARPATPTPAGNPLGRARAGAQISAPGRHAVGDGWITQRRYRDAQARADRAGADRRFTVRVLPRSRSYVVADGTAGRSRTAARRRSAQITCATARDAPGCRASGNGQPQGLATSPASQRASPQRRSQCGSDPTGRSPLCTCSDLRRRLNSVQRCPALPG